MAQCTSSTQTKAMNLVSVRWTNLLFLPQSDLDFDTPSYSASDILGRLVLVS